MDFFGIFQNFLDSLKIIWNLLILLNSLRIFLDSFKIIWNLLESYSPAMFLQAVSAGSLCSLFPVESLEQLGRHEL